MELLKARAPEPAPEAGHHRGDVSGRLLGQAAEELLRLGGGGGRDNLKRVPPPPRASWTWPLATPGSSIATGLKKEWNPNLPMVTASSLTLGENAKR